MKLFIDDERYPVGDDFVIVRSSSEAIEFVKKNGVPTFISFDHDLGGKDTSMVFINWLIEYMLDNNCKAFDFYIHSQNPIGKKNIEGKLNSFFKVL